MSFLTPLYLAGLAAVTLPVLIHLLRRRPRERVAFSTLMFLAPAEPRVTRRERIENWPLLCLRALILALLAAAFARPFLRETASQLIATKPGTTTALLIDASASMQREELWQQAVAATRRHLAAASPQDRVSVALFDQTLQPVLTFEESASLSAAARQDLVQSRLAALAPSWKATHLGTALQQTLATFEELDREAVALEASPRRIVLITDWQAGINWDGLNSAGWPEQVVVELDAITPATSTSAGLHFVHDTTAVGATPTTRRVRIENAADSRQETFQLRWDGTTEETTIYVPRGESRVVTAPATKTAECLRLSGDETPFDNAVFLAEPIPAAVTIAYFGDDTAEDPRESRFFLERAFPPTPERVITIVADTPATPVPVIAPETRLCIVRGTAGTALSAALQQFLRDGGTVLCLPQNEADIQTAAALVGLPSVTAADATASGYAMLGDIDFAHPLFAPFAETSFADFTQIRIWKHRRITLPEWPNARVLARFDDGDPAIVESPAEAGRVLLFTAGWHPADSQWALSSKFAPLLNAVLDLSGAPQRRTARFEVGEPIPLAALGLTPQAVSSAENPFTLITPAGTEQPLARDAALIPATEQPGIFLLTDGSTELARIAVNLSPLESRTTPLPLDALAQHGIRTAPAEARSPALSPEAARQLQIEELERQQQIWKWLIVGALVVVVFETWLAGRPRVAAVPSGDAHEP